MKLRIAGYVLVYLGTAGVLFLEPSVILPLSLLGWVVGGALVVEGVVAQIKKRS